MLESYTESVTLSHCTTYSSLIIEKSAAVLKVSDL